MYLCGRIRQFRQRYPNVKLNDDKKYEKIDSVLRLIQIV